MVRIAATAEFSHHIIARAPVYRGSLQAAEEIAIADFSHRQTPIKIPR
jgi:hypothetical protein